MKHDVIAVGASAGGVDVHLADGGELPADLPDSIFVVVQTAPVHGSVGFERLFLRSLNAHRSVKYTAPPNPALEPARGLRE
jgi:hypothetical protein